MIRAVVIAAALTAVAAPAAAQPLREVPFDRVTIADEFWTPRQAANAAGTLESNLSQCESTGRIANLEQAADKLAGGPGGEYQGYFFNDSDVYKAIQGAAYVRASLPPGAERDALDTRLDAWIATIAAAQQPDGYINSYFTLAEPEGRWTNIRDKHEMYCIGHLIEAGVAHWRATGKRTLLDVAIKAADHLDARFGQDRARNVSGHEEIELALFALADAVQEPRYARLAEFFLSERGHANGRELHGIYAQDHAPIEAHAEAVGHAVRAMYLMSAVADGLFHAPDPARSNALDRVWHDLTQRKMYVTGGIGSSSHNEGFTVAYDLPNDSAYSETCASIGLAMWSARMARLHADASYADVLERTLCNAVIAGVSLDGRSYFYVNPLASRGDHLRQEWFACACCPPNVLRTIASVGGWFYAHDDDTIAVNLYAAGTARITLAAGEVRLEQRTRYPWDGEVTIRIAAAPEGEFDLWLRVPGWCEGSRITAPVDPRRERGYAKIRRAWKAGDEVTISMPMPVRRVVSDPRVVENRGKVTLQRGPLVYCLEGVDHPAISGAVRSLAISRDAQLDAVWNPDQLGGVVTLEGQALPAAPVGRGLYASEQSAAPTSVRAVPYAVWANRSPGEMVVWIPETPALADRPGDATMTPSASHCWSHDDVRAMIDGREPQSSGDHSIPRMTWWPERGNEEWARLDFSSAREVFGVEVYWFCDADAGGGCDVPSSCLVEYLDGDAWKPIAGASLGVEPDRFNAVSFPAVTTQALRLTVALREGRSGGIMEWRVLP